MRRTFGKDNLNLKDRIFALDFQLIFLILILGIISFFAMYSSEQGKFGYYTQNHFYRFCVFFILFLIISLIKIKFWFKSAYTFYFVTLLLLLAVDFFGVTA